MPREGEFAALDPNLADFKEVDYLGHQAERQRYTDPTDFTYDFPGQAGLPLQAPYEWCRKMSDSIAACHTRQRSALLLLSHGRLVMGRGSAELRASRCKAAFQN